MYVSGRWAGCKGEGADRQGGRYARKKVRPLRTTEKMKPMRRTPNVLVSSWAGTAAGRAMGTVPEGSDMVRIAGLLRLSKRGVQGGRLWVEREALF